MLGGQRRRVGFVSLLFALIATVLYLAASPVVAVSAGSDRDATATYCSYDSARQLSAERVSRVGHSEGARIEVDVHRGCLLTPRRLTVVSGVAANAGSRLLSPGSPADEVVNATGGALKTNKGGFTVEIPHGANGITVRVMERGGSRTNYYRVSVPGKETYTVAGEASTDAALTHIGITESSLDDILSIVARIQGGG